MRSGGRKGEHWRTGVVRCGSGIGLLAALYGLVIQCPGDWVEGY